MGDEFIRERDVRNRLVYEPRRPIERPFKELIFLLGKDLNSFTSVGNKSSQPTVQNQCSKLNKKPVPQILLLMPQFCPNCQEDPE